MTDLNYIRERISTAMPTPSLESLKQIQEDLSPHVSELNGVKQNFSALVDAYYSKHHPFKNCELLDDYLNSLIEIIGLATSAEDTQLIDKWGFKALNDILPTNEINKIVTVLSQKYKILGVGTWNYSKYLIDKFGV